MLKAEKRELKRKKQREQMDHGKKLKLLDSLTLRRAVEAEKKLKELNREAPDN